MKFRCERDSLAEAFGAASRAASGRGLNPAMAGLRLDLSGDRLTVTGSDRELTIQLDLAVDGERDGGSVIPARLATDIVKNLGDPRVELEASDEQVTITAGRSHFEVRPYALGDYPRIGTPAAQGVTIAAGDLADAMRQVVRAASTDELRQVLTGVHMSTEAEGLRLVATDSYRLAVRDLPGQSMLSLDQAVIVPSRALNELSRVVGASSELTLHLGQHEATFEVAATRITTRLIDGAFPNYRQLIPAGPATTLTVSKDALIDAIRRVKLLARDAVPVKLDMNPDGLYLSATTQDVGQASEQIDATLNGDPIAVAFNPDYLVAGIDACAGDEITLSVQGSNKPVVLRGTGHPEFLYLLMPVRV